MAPSAVTSGLETEDHSRDAAFNKALHGKSADSRGGFAAMRSKDSAAQKAAVEEYFKHWDNKSAAVETEETRKERRDEYATLTRQYVNPAPPSLHFNSILQSNFSAVTTTLPPTSTNTVGALRFISVASPMVKVFTKPSLVTNTISPSRWTSKKTHECWTSDVVSEVQLER